MVGPKGARGYEITIPAEPVEGADVEIGDCVCVVATNGSEPCVIRATVTEYGASISWDGSSLNATIPRGGLGQEGINWCRGWEGPEVDALRAAEALK
jgi:hypothetical protein